VKAGVILIVLTWWAYWANIDRQERCEARLRAEYAAADSAEPSRAELRQHCPESER
jgi:hypothetical protein